MLQLSLRSSNSHNGKKAEMFIDHSSGYIDFYVVHEDQQFDFSVGEYEWVQFKVFIDTAITQSRTSEDRSLEPLSV